MESLRKLPPVEQKPEDIRFDLPIYESLQSVGVDAGILKAAADLEAREKLRSAVSSIRRKRVDLEIVTLVQQTRQSIESQRPELLVETFVTPNLPVATLDNRFLGYVSVKPISRDLMDATQIDGVSLGDLSVEMFDFEFTPRMPGIDIETVDDSLLEGVQGQTPIEAAHYGKLASCTFYLAPHVSDFPLLIAKLHEFSKKYNLSVIEVEWLMANFYHDLSSKYLHKIAKLPANGETDYLDNFVNNNPLLELSDDTRDTDFVIALLYAQKALINYAGMTEMEGNFEKMDNYYLEFLLEEFG